MMAKNKATPLIAKLKNTSRLMAVNLIKPFISFLLLPIHMYFLSPEEYGVYGLLMAFMGILGNFANLKLSATIKVKHFQNKSLTQDSPFHYIQNIFSVLLLIGIGLYIILSFAGHWLFQQIWTENNIDFYPYGSLATGICLTGMCIEAYHIYLKNLLDTQTLTFNILSSLLISTTIQLILLIEFELGILSILIGSMAANLLYVGYLIIVKKLFTFNIKRTTILSSLKLSLPLIPYSIAESILAKIDRYLISISHGVASVGVYTLTFSIAGISNLIFNATLSSIRPLVYTELNLDKYGFNKKIYTSYTYYITINCIALLLLFLVGSNLEALLDKPKYKSVQSHLGIALLSFTPSIMSRIINLELMFLNKSMLIAKATIVKLVPVIVSFMLVIPRYGIDGAIVIITGSNLSTLALFIYIIRLYRPVNLYPWRLYISSITLTSLALLTPIWGITGLVQISCILSSILLIILIFFIDMRISSPREKIR